MDSIKNDFFRVADVDKHSACTDVLEVDEDQHLVFGWFSVIEEGGEAVVDRQGDVIEEETLEKAVYDFVLTARTAGDSHERIGIGRLVESMMFTKEKQKSLGIDLGRVGWYGGFHIDDEEVWKKIKMGHYPSFSIGGHALREEYTETE